MLDVCPALPMYAQIQQKVPKKTVMQKMKINTKFRCFDSLYLSEMLIFMCLIVITPAARREQRWSSH